MGEKIAKLVRNIGHVFFGKEDVVRMMVVALIARGHMLIEDVPGVGKTLLGIALARSIQASFRRIQFTNDLLPSDILGVSILRNGGFDFRAGPIFSNVVLADEINRTTPKTQSALLEAMNDLQVSIEGETRPLPEPFLVIATQNPVEYHGTFPLPEAQLDRFLMRLKIGYPEAENEKRILREKDLAMQAGGIEPVLTVPEVIKLQKSVDKVRVDDSVMDYVVRIANATRENERLKLGLSPRGSLALCRAAQAHALSLGRDYAEPDDVKAVAVAVAAHRILLDSSLYGVARIEAAEALVQELVRKVPSPV